MRNRKSVLLLPFVAVCLLSVCWSTKNAHAQSKDLAYKYFNNSIVKPPVGAQTNFLALSPEALQRKLELHFALETNNFADLQTRVARGEVISPSEMKEKYAGNKQALDRLVAWLRGQGFEIVKTSPDYTNVYAEGTVAQIEKTLGVKMSPVTYKGITTPAATTAPRLPRDIGEHVTVIDGLQPFIRAVKHVVTRADYLKELARRSPAVPRPNTATQPTYKVKDILRAYDANMLGSSGKGQSIAILIDAFPATTDVQTFWQKSGLQNQPLIQLVNFLGASTPLPPPQGEETLDTEWASGIAPAATVRVYASGSLQYAYLDAGLEQIYADALNAPGLRIVSISLGLREDAVSAGEIQIEHSDFVKMAAIGMTVFVSSGDAGSNPDITGHARSSDTQVEYESSDPFTVAVGGTSLQLNRQSGVVVRETGWIDSGGGVSVVFDRQSWQPAYAGISSSKRLVPDIIAVADPDPGAFTWFNGNEWPVGGTSWSTPIWAGLYALIADARARQGKAPLPSLAAALYRLPPNAGLRDITSGSNGAYHAGPGWDPVTGLGTPDAKVLLSKLP